MADTPVVDPTPFQCGQCPSKYARLDHLHRHELKHDGQKSCVCTFCNAQFYRRDILRRHYNTCKQRGDRQIPSSQQRGRRRQACDQCASNKLACDLDRPCQHCGSRKLVCSWTRLQNKSPISTAVGSQRQQTSNTPISSQPASETSPLPFDAIAEIPQETPQPTPAPQVRCFALENVPVPFLLNFVSLESRSFVATFGYSSVAPEPLPQLSWPNSSSQPPQDFPGERAIDRGMNALMHRSSSSSSAPDLSFLHDLNSNGLNISGQGPLLYRAPGEVFADSPEPTNPPDATRRRLSELVMHLTDIYITLPKSHPGRASSVKINHVDKFFTISKFHMFTQTYFHHFYPHCPIVHRPSYNLSTASLPIILVICLAGALYSSLPEATTMAQGLLDLAEEYVFRNPYFEQLSKGKLSEVPTQDCDGHLEAMQAAVMIVFLQNWEGNEEARRRVRIERFGAIISSARALRLTTPQSPFFPTWTPPHPFDWRLLVVHETWLRVMHYIFILDSGFCIFHNYPPRLALAELAAPMPCSEEIFSAVSSTDCSQKIYKENIIQPRFLGPTLKLLLAEDLEEDAKTELTKLTTLQYFIIISALHVLLWTSRANSFGKTDNKPIERALSLWATLWESNRKQSPPRQFKGLGFIKNAGEYWWLAKLQIHIAEHGSEALQRGSGDIFINAPFEDDQMSYIRFLLQHFCRFGILDLI